jgi:hypothetical protein
VIPDFDPLTDQHTITVHGMEKNSLICKELALHPMYEKLVDYSNSFFEDIDELKDHKDFQFLSSINHHMRTLLREVVRTSNEEMRKKYLAKVYKWYTTKMDAIGGRSQDDKENEEKMFNPDAVEMERLGQLEKDHHKLKLLKDVNMI